MKTKTLLITTSIIFGMILSFTIGWLLKEITIKKENVNVDFEPKKNEKLGQTFIKTYNVLNVADSNDYKYLYITLRQFQCEEVVTVKIKRELCLDILVGNNYEFTFEFTDSMVEENISSIFSNTILKSINVTDKLGIEQIEDPVS